MSDTVCKMPVKQNGIPDIKLQPNIQSNELNLSNNKNLDNNNNVFATNKHEINTQDINNKNFNNNYQQVSNKRRINEDSINNDCNNKLNKKFKHEEIDTEENGNGVCTFIAYLWALEFFIFSNNFKTTRKFSSWSNLNQELKSLISICKFCVL